MPPTADQRHTRTPIPSDSIAELLGQLDGCLLRDRRRLRNRIHDLRRRGSAGSDPAAALGGIRRAIEASRAARASRLERLPRPVFDPALPVCERRNQIAEAIEANPVVIVAGATGSGKTTQLPKICLDLGRGVDGQIGCTQPRRIAAISVAARVAEELDSETGDLVGYKTRFGARHRPENLVRFMTDGILLAETQGDRRLQAYDTLIIDEAHERSLNIDLLLGYLKQLLPRRPDLKLIVSSATLDTERFAQFFGGAPVVEVEGRTYPVDIDYREPGPERELADTVADNISELVGRSGAGDILAFFSGERDIREAVEALADRAVDAEVLPLYGRLSQVEQARVFRPSKRRKVVLATNVAETSLTIPGVRYVVDTGLARIHRYSHRAQVSRLQVEPVSQASCNQRAGRCGRVGPGVCLRLYSEQDYLDRAAFTDPEIQRSSLAEVILRMESLGLSRVDRFPFIDPPPDKAVSEGYRVLEELQALAPKGGLSAIGKRLAQLPLDPRLGRMLVAAEQMGCVAEVLVIAAGLSIQDPRERPLEKQQAADQKHRQFRDEQSDFVSVLNLWKGFLNKLEERPSRSALRRWCRQNFLSYNRMVEWRDTRQQLESLLRETRVSVENPPAEYAPLHCALLTGLLSRLGQLQDKGLYLGARQLHFYPFPGSVLFRKSAKWVVAAELVDTSRLYGRTLARIDVAWVEPLAAHLVRRSYSDPHWEKKRGRVFAFEQVTLYGLPVVTRRKVPYAPIDPPLSRELFIRHALVQGELRTGGAFLSHNLALVEQVESLEHRSRRRDILVDDPIQYAFYDGRVPEDICDTRDFERWRVKLERDQPRRLFMDRETLMRHAAAEVTGEQYPDTVELAGGRLELDYRFEPTEVDDGVTLQVPLARLAQLRQQELQWLVPGLRQELLEGLLRGLPKALRRNFVPVPEFAAAAAAALDPSDGPLPNALSAYLLRTTGVEVPPQAWSFEQLPRHLQMNYRVVDQQQQTVDQGRDLAALQQSLAKRARHDFSKLPQGRWTRERVIDWDFGPLPEQITVGHGEQAALGFPVLVDHRTHVSLELLHQPEQAASVHHAGVRRLLAQRLGTLYKKVANGLPLDAATTLAYAQFGSSADLRQAIVDGAIERLCPATGAAVRDPERFAQSLTRAGAQLSATARELWDRVAPLLVMRQAIAAQLQGRHPGQTDQAIADIRSQLSYLFCPGFTIGVPDQRLGQYPRYLKAIARRLEKVRQQPGKDVQWLAQVEPFWAEVRRRIGEPGGQIVDPELEQLRWLVEEFRVSLFAQDLGTAQPVSAKRLRKQLDRVIANGPVTGGAQGR